MRGVSGAHRYRVIRQGDTIFVRIDDNPEFCGVRYVSLGTGVPYAISAEGRILRRVFDGQADQLPAAVTDGGLCECRSAFDAVQA
jgi:hypothetical protein